MGQRAALIPATTIASSQLCKIFAYLLVHYSYIEVPVSIAAISRVAIKRHSSREDFTAERVQPLAA